MTKRALVLAVLVAALAVPAVSLADPGNGQGKGNGPASTAGAKMGRNGAVLEVLSRRLDKRFQAFSSRCLVANAPEKCAKVANHFVRRLDKLATLLKRAEAKIKEKCGAANPPARCSSASAAIGRIDALLAKIASQTAAIKAAFPNAGSSTGS
jgi:hypothetical protein